MTLFVRFLSLLLLTPLRSRARFVTSPFRMCNASCLFSISLLVKVFEHIEHECVFIDRSTRIH